MKRGILLFIIAFFAWTTSAYADVKVVVRSFPGPGGANMQRAVIQQLKASKGIRLVSEDAAKKVAKRRSVKLSGAAKIGVARQLGVAAWVEGRTRKKGGKIHATIQVINASDNDVVDTWSFTRKTPSQLTVAVRQQFRKQMRGAFRNVSAPERERSYERDRYEEDDDALGGIAAADDTRDEPMESQREVEERRMPEFEPVAQASDDERVPSSRGSAELRIDGDEAEPAREGKMSGLEARFAIGMMHRKLTYNDAFSRNLGDYRLPAAPLADVGLSVFPGGFVSDGPASWVGFDFHGQFAFGIASEGQDGTKYESGYKAFDANLVFRMPIKRHLVNAYAGYGLQSFTMEDRGNIEAPVPDVDYRSIRAGLGARFALGDMFRLGLEAGYLYLLSIGELQSDAWFPNASGAGLEGQLYADASMYKGLSARAFLAYQHRFFDFNSEPEHLRIAGGAVDGYLTTGLGIGYTY